MRESWRQVPALALVFAAIWLCDVPAAVMATYALAVMIAASCALQRSWRPAARGAAAMAGGFGLAAFYILPAAWERRWVQIAQVTADNLQPARNFLFTRASDPAFVAFNWKVSTAVAGIAVVTVAGATLARRGTRERREISWVLGALAVVSLFLMLPSSAVLWRLLPELQFVQFPWRWGGILAVAFAFFTGAALNSAPKRTTWIVGVALAAAIGCSAALMIRDGWWDADDVPEISQAIQSGRGYEGTDEYQPIGSDRSELPGNPEDTGRPAGVSANPASLLAFADHPASGEAARARPEFRIVRWTAEQKDFTVSASAPAVAALRLLAYPAWQVRLDGRLSQFDSQPKTGQMLVAVPAGEHRVEIRFVRTWDRELGGIISMAAMIAMGAFSIWGTKQQ
jgi:hypothetical protein